MKQKFASNCGNRMRFQHITKELHQLKSDQKKFFNETQKNKYLLHVPKNQHLSAVRISERLFFSIINCFHMCSSNNYVSTIDIYGIFLYAHKLINFRHSGANIFFHAFFVLI
ncbi:hypothetical protein ACKWTF_013370 [Chironomus riparius]